MSSEEFIEGDSQAILEDVEEQIRESQDPEWQFIREIYLMKKKHRRRLPWDQLNKKKFKDYLRELRSSLRQENFLGFMLFYVVHDQPDLDEELVDSLTEICFEFDNDSQSSPQVLMYIYFFLKRYMFLNPETEERRKEFILRYEKRSLERLSRSSVSRKVLADLRIMHLFHFSQRNSYLSFQEKCDMFELFLTETPSAFNLQHIKAAAYVRHYMKAQVRSEVQILKDFGSYQKSAEESFEQDKESLATDVAAFERHFGELVKHFLLQMADGFESQILEQTLQNKLAYLNFSAFLVDNMFEFKTHFLKVLFSIKEDLRKQNFLVAEEKKQYEAKRNYSDIKSLRKLEEIEDSLRFGDKSFSAQKIVLTLLKIFSHVKRIDAEMFDFVYDYFLDNVTFFDTNDLIKAFQFYSILMSFVFKILDYNNRQGVFKDGNPISKRALGLYVQQKHQLRKQNAKLIEEIIPILHIRREELSYQDRMIFLYGLVSTRYNNSFYMRHIFDFYFETFEAFKTGVFQIYEIQFKGSPELQSELLPDFEAKRRPRGNARKLLLGK